MTRPGPDNRWFFVHVMKTGGTTVRALFDANHDKRHLYPCHLDDPIVKAKIDPQFIRGLSPERLDEIHIYSAHIPAYAREFVPHPTRSLTVLREPVARTISWLRQNQRIHSPDATLEQIYDVEAARRGYADNHQSRLFGARSSDELNSFTNYIEIDDARFAEARARLDDTDMVGFQEDLERFLDVVAVRFGYETRAVPSKNVAEGTVEISDALRRRIEADNAYDIEFYEYARRTRWDSF